MRRSPLVLSLISSLAAAPGAAQANQRAATLKTLYQFPGGGDGLEPWSGLVDVGGTLYGTTFQGGAYGRGSVFKINPKTGAEALVYSFKGGGDASEPQAGPLAAGGLLYGTSNIGGVNGYGTVYSVNPATGAEKVLFSFTPAMGGGSGSSLVQAGGYLYGTTYGGGTGLGYGTVFKVNIATGVGTVLYSFTGGADGASPQYGVAYAKGILYGTATEGGPNGSGTLFAVNAVTGAERTLFSFDGGGHGGDPNGGVIDVNGVLYGTASYGGRQGNGVVFAYTLSTGKESIVYNFTNGADGGEPLASLIDVKGTLFGTTATGGANGYGTVFSLDAATGVATTLYAFQGGANGQQSEAPVLDVDNVLYGTDLGSFSALNYHGTVFKIALTTGVATTLHQFHGATNLGASELLDVGGTLYGATVAGGANYAGTVYKLDPAGGAPSTIYTFTGGADGGGPSNGLVNYGGALYGVASFGGANQDGVIYSIDPATGTQTVVYSFPAGVALPVGPLLLVKGLLYGVTHSGGNRGGGTVFAFNPKSDTLATVYNFTGGADGDLPNSGVTESDGFLYGTTYEGGTGYAGTVYKINIATGAETVLHNFSFGSTDGELPAATPLVLNGVLYGTTALGGTLTPQCFGGLGCGVLYSLDRTSGIYKVLHAFDYNTEGESSGIKLLAVGSLLYGATWGNGEPSWGTFYAYGTTNASFKTIYNFTGGADGGGPEGTLVNVGGTLFGTSSEGTTYNNGTIFSLKP
jgi:uncharacterized repeat protein (TIGR03803 family)